jgi:hypothetical protein
LGKSVRKGRETIAAYGAVMKSPELSLGAKVLWGIYRAYDFKGRGSWPGDETLAEHMGKSESSVQKYRRELLEKSFLKQTLRGRWPAIYRAVVPVYVLFPPRLGFSQFKEALVALTELCLATLRGDDDRQRELQERCDALLNEMNLDALNAVLDKRPSREAIETELMRQLFAITEEEES